MGFFFTSRPIHLLCASALALGLSIGEKANATVTISGTPTGLSTFQQTLEEDGTAGTPIIYAGFAGTCTGTSARATCDSCDGTVVNNGGTNYTTWPCNFTNAYPNLILHMEFSVSNTAVTSSTPVMVQIGSEDVSNVTSVYNGGVLTVEVPWGAICDAAATGNTACTTAVSKDLTVGFKNIGGSSSTTDTTTLSVRTRYVDSSATSDKSHWEYKDCDLNNGGTAPTTPIGFCHFQTYPGDNKIYADNLWVEPSSYPKSVVTGVDYNGVVFFYEEQLSGEPDATTVSRITNKSPHTTISINTRATPPVADNRITGLKNGTRYCFIMANRDISGVMTYFTPTQGADARPTTELCGTP